MITSAQMRAARALLGMDQKQLAEASGVSLPTIQRMEASDGNVRGVVDTLMKVIEAFERLGVEMIGENSFCDGGGRGVRFREAKRATQFARDVMAPPGPAACRRPDPPPLSEDANRWFLIRSHIAAQPSKSGEPRLSRPQQEALLRGIAMQHRCFDPLGKDRRSR